MYFCARNEAEGQATCDGVVKAGGKAFFTKVDVANEEQLKAWIDSVRAARPVHHTYCEKAGAAEGKIDIMIPNAAAFVFGHIEDVWYNASPS